MKLWNHIVGLAALVAIFSTGLVSAQEQEAGVVRISDRANAGQPTQTVSHSEACLSGNADCQDGRYCQDCQNCRKCKNGHSPFLCPDCHGSQNLFQKLFSYRPIHCHYDPATGRMKYFDRFGNAENGGLFGRGGMLGDGSHMGKGGLFCNKCRRTVHGTQAPFGMYKMAYPLDAHHFDARDGGLYAAQGYGVNISVPLAPTVAATYNYGWGVPSSRMTYISNPIPCPPTYEPAIPVQPALPVQP